MTRKRKGTDWQMQPKVNQTPGAQGTLFHGGPNRWPRGHTPERALEVRNAIRTVGASPPRSGSMSDGFDKKAWGEEVRSKHRVVSTIARSTMPMSDLEGQNVSVQSVSPQLAAHRPALDRGAAGVYMGQRNGSKVHEILVAQAGEQSSTVIHELGHAVSNIRGTAHSAYDTPAVRGREEAYADDYAATHFRDRRGRTETQYEYHPNETLAPGHQGKVEFSEAYRAARKMPLPKGSFELMEEHDQFHRDNPTLPGMERAGRRPGYSSPAQHPMYEMPYQHERRIASRRRQLGM